MIVHALHFMIEMSISVYIRQALITDGGMLAHVSEKQSAEFELGGIVKSHCGYRNMACFTTVTPCTRTPTDALFSSSY